MRQQSCALIFLSWAATGTIAAAFSCGEKQLTFLPWLSSLRRTRSERRRPTWTSAFGTQPEQPLPLSRIAARVVVAAARSQKDWDAILAQDDNDTDPANDEFFASLNQVPRDMVYNERNCNRSQQTFVAITQAAPDAPCADVYATVRLKHGENVIDDDTEAVFWFIGKVAHVSDVTLTSCVQRQWNIIQHHAANLRRLDLYAAMTSRTLDIWCATPGNSELDVAYNRPHVVFTKIEAPEMTADTASSLNDIKTFMVGFQGEVYDRGEEGFRTWRSALTGRATRPEIDAGGPNMEEDDDDDDDVGRAPTDEEMQQIMQALEGKDINDVYEEQERRRNEKNDNDA